MRIVPIFFYIYRKHTHIRSLLILFSQYNFPLFMFVFHFIRIKVFWIFRVVYSSQCQHIIQKYLLVSPFIHSYMLTLSVYCSSVNSLHFVICLRMNANSTKKRDKACAHLFLSYITFSQTKSKKKSCSYWHVRYRAISMSNDFNIVKIIHDILFKWRIKTHNIQWI